MKQFTHILLLLLISISSYGQTISRQVIGTTGSFFTTAAGKTLSSTVGEVMVTTERFGDIILTQGFQQPNSTIFDGDVLKFYSGFSPNNDGVNDVWWIDNIKDFPDNTVQIFNRWGNEVFFETGYNNKDRVWDGTGDDGLLTTATYFYVVKIDNKTYKGWVELTK